MKSVTFHLGDVDYHPSTGALTDETGAPVQLRHKSKAVLAYLADQPNRIVTKSELLDSIWSDVTVSDESLVQCIADIRRLIGQDARSILETVPRQGYKLNPPSRRSGKPVGSLTLPALFVVVLTLPVFLTFGRGEQQETVGQQLETPTGQPAAPPGTEVTDAYLEVLKGRVSAASLGRDESLIAERHFRHAIALDPNYARAYAELGTLLAVRFENDWNVIEEADKAKALFYAERAAELAPDLWLAHYALGRLYSVVEDFSASERHLQIALELRPENEDARAYFAVVRNLQGHTNEAIEILEAAVMSHPDPPFWYYFALGHALFNSQQLAAAEMALTRCLDLAHESPYCLRYIIATYGKMGRQNAARVATEAYRELGYEASVSAMVDLVRFHHSTDRERLMDGLRLAGLPE